MYDGKTEHTHKIYALPPVDFLKCPLVPCIISLRENISMRLGRVGLHIRECDR